MAEPESASAIDASDASLAAKRLRDEVAALVERDPSWSRIGPVLDWNRSAARSIWTWLAQNARRRGSRPMRDAESDAATKAVAAMDVLHGAIEALNFRAARQALAPGGLAKGGKPYFSLPLMLLYRSDAGSPQDDYLRLFLALLYESRIDLEPRGTQAVVASIATLILSGEPAGEIDDAQVAKRYQELLALVALYRKALAALERGAAFPELGVQPSDLETLRRMAPFA